MFGLTRIQIGEQGAENMAQKTEYLPIRLSPEEKQLVEFLTKDYGMEKVSDFFRAMVNYVDRERPTITIVPEGKALLPGGMRA